MNIKSLLFFSLLFFSSMHAMNDGPFYPLKDAQQRFFAAIEDDTNDEQQKIAALKEILDANSDNRAAILNCIRTVNDKNQTAFSIALEKDLATENEKHTVLQYLVQQPEFDVNVIMLTKLLIVNQGEITRNRTPLICIIEVLNFTYNFKIDKQKKLFTIANEILNIHKDKINTQQLFDAYQALLADHSNGKSLNQDRLDLLNTIINHEKFDINLLNSRGLTPLAIAVINKNYSVEVIQALIDKGADLNKKYSKYDHFLKRFLTTSDSILDIAIKCKKYDIAKILYDTGVRSINSETYETLEILQYFPKEKGYQALFTAINDLQNPQLVVNSWSSAKTSSLGAIGALTIFYDFCRFKKPEKVTDDKKDRDANVKEKSKKETKHDKKKESKDKKERSRWERIKKHTRNYKKDLSNNPRNHKKLMIPVSCLLFRLLKDPIQYRNTRFA